MSGQSKGTVYAHAYFSASVERTLQADNFGDIFAGLTSVALTAFMVESYINYLCEKIQRVEGMPIKILRVYFNVQHSGMDGDWHEDDGDTTYLLMITKTLKPGDGCFEIKENNKIKKINFVQNRLVYFNATTPHRGRCTKKPDKEPRITLAFKTERT